MEMFKAVTAIVLISVGAVFMLISVIGVFRMKFVLNRMHSAALADTCGILFIIAGLMVLSGFTFMSLKLLLILVIFWLTSPVSGHLLSNMVKSTMSDEMAENLIEKELEKKQV